MTVDETDLVLGARRGDVAAFEVLAERYYPVCLRFARSHLGVVEDAEEVVQDAVLRAYSALRRGRVPESFRPWLLRIVLNRCRSLVARRARRRRLLGLWWTREAVSERVAEPPPDPPEVDPALREALAALSPPLREAFLLKHVEELTYEELSEVTGVGVSALKMRVKRAGEALLEMLGEDR